MAALLIAALPSSLVHRNPYKSRTITDVIHRSIDLHPLAVAIIDTPEYQRLRSVSQLGVCDSGWNSIFAALHLAASDGLHLECGP